MTFPVVIETSAALQPVDRDSFLDDGGAAQPGALLPPLPSPETLRRRRILD